MRNQIDSNTKMPTNELESFETVSISGTTNVAAAKAYKKPKKTRKFAANSVAKEKKKSSRTARGTSIGNSLSPRDKAASTLR